MDSQEPDEVTAGAIQESPAAPRSRIVDFIEATWRAAAW